MLVSTVNAVRSARTATGQSDISVVPTAMPYLKESMFITKLDRFFKRVAKLLPTRRRFSRFLKDIEISMIEITVVFGTVTVLYHVLKVALG
jgi:hypothetical protein